MHPQSDPTSLAVADARLAAEVLPEDPLPEDSPPAELPIDVEPPRTVPLFLSNRAQSRLDAAHRVGDHLMRQHDLLQQIGGCGPGLPDAAATPEEQELRGVMRMAAVAVKDAALLFLRYSYERAMRGGAGQRRLMTGHAEPHGDEPE